MFSIISAASNIVVLIFLGVAAIFLVVVLSCASSTIKKCNQDRYDLRVDIKQLTDQLQEQIEEIAREAEKD